MSKNRKEFVRLNVSVYRINANGWYALNRSAVVADFQVLNSDYLNIAGYNPGSFIFARRDRSSPLTAGMRFDAIMLRKDAEAAGFLPASSKGDEFIFDGEPEAPPERERPREEFLQPLRSLTLGRRVLLNCADGAGGVRYVGIVEAVDGDYFLLANAALSGYGIEDMFSEGDQPNALLQGLIKGRMLNFKKVLVSRASVSEIIFLEDSNEAN